MKGIRHKLDKKGMTLVEVITAFVILLIGMSALIHATTASLKIINKSQEIQREADAAVLEYYKTEGKGGGETAAEEIAVTLKPAEGGEAGKMKMKLHTYKSSPDNDNNLEGGRVLYYFQTGGDADGTD